MNENERLSDRERERERERVSLFFPQNFTATKINIDAHKSLSVKYNRFVLFKSGLTSSAMNLKSGDLEPEAKRRKTFAHAAMKVKQPTTTHTHTHTHSVTPTKIHSCASWFPPR